MDWPIQEVARLAGTTSRTLRHYAAVGLLEPSRIGANGYRYYDGAALVRLQRILMLRDLGLGIPAIDTALANETDAAHALAGHVRSLRQEKLRLDRQIDSVEDTLNEMKKGRPLMADTMFDGFDHTHHKEEVEERWGAKAYSDSDAWWRGKTAEQKTQWKAESAVLGAAWTEGAASGVSPDSPQANDLARRQFEWLSSIPGTPQHDGGPTMQYFLGLAEMYVADDRFAANYGGTEGATFVGDAMTHWAAGHYA